MHAQTYLFDLIASTLHTQGLFQRYIYSVTQSYANSFWGYVVLDSFKNVSRNGENILDQIYKKQMCSDFYHEDFKFWELLKQMHN